jgi:hypothetical protein
VPQVGYRDIATIKYNSAGIEQWVSRYNFGSGTNDDIPVALRIDPENNIYVCGKSVGDTTGWDYVTMKYDSNGVNLWEHRYTMPGNSADVPANMKLDDSSNVYVTGASSGYSVNPALWDDYATIKYNSDGDTLWIRRFNSAAGPIPNDEAKDLAVDAFGNVYVTGNVPSTTTNGDDIYTLKYDSNGNIIWQNRWDSPFGFEDHPYKMKLDQPGNSYITGYSKSDGSTAGNDYVTLKIDSGGNLTWEQLHNGTNGTIDNAYDIAIDQSNNIIVTGQSYGNGDDYLTIKYNQTLSTDVENNSSEEIINVFPNPASDQLNISIASLSEKEPVKISILNSLGSEVLTTEFRNGIQELNIRDFSEGIYFLNIRNDIMYKTMKVVIQ